LTRFDSLRLGLTSRRNRRKILRFVLVQNPSPRCFRPATKKQCSRVLGISQGTPCLIRPSAPRDGGRCQGTDSSYYPGKLPSTERRRKKFQLGNPIANEVPIFNNCARRITNPMKRLQQSPGWPRGSPRLEQAVHYSPDNHSPDFIREQCGLSQGNDCQGNKRFGDWRVIFGRSYSYARQTGSAA